MASKKNSSKRSIHDLSRLEVDSTAIEDIRKELEESSDRAAAIVGTAVVQSVLCTLILEKLECKDAQLIKKMYAQNGPLASFYSQMHLARAMKLIDDATLREMDVLRRVRNAFAHSISSISFTTPEVLEECRKFRCPRQFGGHITKFPSPFKGKLHFNLVVLNLVLGANNRIRSLLRRRLGVLGRKATRVQEDYKILRREMAIGTKRFRSLREMALKGKRMTPAELADFKKFIEEQADDISRNFGAKAIKRRLRTRRLLK